MSKRSIILAVAAVILFGLALFSAVMDKKVIPGPDPDQDPEPDLKINPIQAKVEYKAPEPEQDVLLPDLGSSPKTAKKKVIEQ
jgi:hypothetical protein